jgi:murein DD-endopeptidase MepM/ murein hydrolase activator NlpD
MKSKTALGIVLYLAITALLIHFSKDTSRELVANIAPAPPPAPEVIPAEIGPDPMEAFSDLPDEESIPAPPEPAVTEIPPSQTISSAIFGPGDSFAGVLKRLGVEDPIVAELALAVGKEVNVRTLSPGDSVKIYLDPPDNRLVKVELEKENECVVTMEKGGSSWSAQKRPVTLQTYLFHTQGEIGDSFYQAGLEAGLTPQTILDFADIFAGDVDFLTGVLPGDRFSVVCEKLYRNDDFVRDGKILAARFINQGQKFEAFYFESPGQSGAYYDRKGKSLRKTFLKSPLQYTRISSYFSYRRLHPILGIYRPHLGIDYAAPSGTPVSSVADGKVIYKGWNGGYGRFVKVAHRSGYISTYAHLRSYGRGVREGASVRQGQVIGYVGRSGLATGNHLDFRLLKNGKYIDPLKIRCWPAADPISKKQWAKFQGIVSHMTANLDAQDRKLVLLSDKDKTRTMQ